MILLHPSLCTAACMSTPAAAAPRVQRAAAAAAGQTTHSAAAYTGAATSSGTPNGLVATDEAHTIPPPKSAASSTLASALNVYAGRAVHVTTWAPSPGIFYSPPGSRVCTLDPAGSARHVRATHKQQPEQSAPCLTHSTCTL